VPRRTVEQRAVLAAPSLPSVHLNPPPPLPPPFARRTSPHGLVGGGVASRRQRLRSGRCPQLRPSRRTRTHHHRELAPGQQPGEPRAVSGPLVDEAPNTHV